MPMDLHAACSSGDLEAIKQALRLDPDAIHQERDGYLPIQSTVPAHPAALAYLLQSGEDPNQSIRTVHWFDWEDAAIGRGLTGWRLIHMAALHGYHEHSTRTVEVLHQNGARLSEQSPLRGYSALHLAAIPDMHRVAGCLVAAGLDVDIRSTEIDPPFDWPQLMDTSPFHPLDGSRATPLMVACGEGHLETARVRLQLGADVTARDSSGHTPLRLSVPSKPRSLRPDCANNLHKLFYGALGLTCI